MPKKTKYLLSGEELSWSFYSGFAAGALLTICVLCLLPGPDPLPGNVIFGLSVGFILIQYLWGKRLPKRFVKVEVEDE